MAIIFYRDIKFTIPELISEDDFNLLKKNGVSNYSELPRFLTFHFSNLIFFFICILVYYLNKIAPTYFPEIIWQIIFIFWVPKVLIESYKYIKFRYKEHLFKKRLLALLDSTTSYFEFQVQYEDQFIKSRLGKFLIKKFIKN